MIGGGVIGCSVARALAASGASVTVLERAVPGREATWAAGGMLSPLGETSHTGDFFRLSLASFDRYPAWVAALAAESGIDPEYRPAGKLHVARSVQEVEDFDHLLAGAEGFGAQLLTGEEARALEPALAPALLGAIFVGRDQRVDNRLLGTAVWKAAAARGAQFCLGADVASLRLAGADGSRRVSGVRLGDGSEQRGGNVVIAAGAWSGSLQGLPAPLPVAPVRGQMAAVESLGAGRPLLDHVIHASNCYLIPREGGRVVIGATAEHVGFSAGPTPRGIAGLLAAAMVIVPAIADLPLVESWAGFRPGTPDDLPIIGPDPMVSGLYYATGHYRNGVLLAPITGEIIRALITGEESPVSIGAFRPDRWIESS